MGRLIDINPVISNLTAMKSMYDAILLNARILERMVQNEFRSD